MRVSAALARLRGTAARTRVGWLGCFSELVTIHISRGGAPSLVMMVAAEAAHMPVATMVAAQRLFGDMLTPEVHVRTHRLCDLRSYCHLKSGSLFFPFLSCVFFVTPLFGLARLIHGAA